MDNLVRDYFDQQAEAQKPGDGKENLSIITKQQQREHILNIIDKLDLERGSRALDLGCGDGVMSVELIQRGLEVVAVDFSEKMLELARKNCAKKLHGHKISFRTDDVEDMDLQTKPFDIVIAIDLIEYLKFDRWALHVMSWLLKPGGTLIITAPNLISLKNITDPIRIFSFALQVMKRFLNRVSGRKLFNHFRYQKIGSEVLNNLSRNNYLSSRLIGWFDVFDCKVINFYSHGFGPFWPLGKSSTLSLLLHKLFQKGSNNKFLTFFSKLGNDYLFHVQKLVDPSEIAKKHIFENMEDRIKNFERNEKAYFDCPYFTQLHKWLNKDPEYLNLPLEKFKPEATAREEVLVLSPHPDDELIGCGGIMMKMLEREAKIRTIYLTDGCNSYSLKRSNAPEELRHSIRLDEAKRVARKLGVDELISWEIHDGEVKCTEDNVSKLTRILEKYRPRFIFIPFINDIHPDHIATNDLTEKALMASSLDLARLSVLNYEVWSKVPANVYCIIDRQFEKKARLLMEYRTALKDWNHVCVFRTIPATDSGPKRPPIPVQSGH